MSWASSSAGWSSFSEEQIREILVQTMEGVRLVELADRYQVPEFVIRGWQSRYGSTPATDPAPTRSSAAGTAPADPDSADALGRAQAKIAHLEDENARLRRILVEVVLENRSLKQKLGSTGQ